MLILLFSWKTLENYFDSVQEKQIYIISLLIEIATYIESMGGVVD